MYNIYLYIVYIYIYYIYIYIVCVILHFGQALGVKSQDVNVSDVVFLVALESFDFRYSALYFGSCL